MIKRHLVIRRWNQHWRDHYYHDCWCTGECEECGIRFNCYTVSSDLKLYVDYPEPKIPIQKGGRDSKSTTYRYIYW